MQSDERSARLFLRPALIALTMLLASPVDGVCPALLPQSGTYGYAQRSSGRCEGLYREQVSGLAALTLESLTAGMETVDPTKTSKLVVKWKPFTATSMSLRAHNSARNTSLYEMDVSVAPTSGRFDWPTDVVGPLRIAPASLQIVAWSGIKIGSREKIVYVPVALASGTFSTDRYDLTLRTGVAIKDVTMTICEISREGAVIRVVEPSRSIRGNFTARDVVRTQIASRDLHANSIYQVSFAASVDSRTPQTGGTINNTFYFMHAQ